MSGYVSFGNTSAVFNNGMMENFSFQFLTNTFYPECQQNVNDGVCRRADEYSNIALKSVSARLMRFYVRLFC